MTSHYILFAAIYGYHFCKAAKRGFTLLVSNALRLMALNTVGDFCLFLAKILVVIVVVVIGMQITEVTCHTIYYCPPVQKLIETIINGERFITKHFSPSFTGNQLFQKLIVKRNAN